MCWRVMKVLQVNCVYKKGSTGKITYDLQKGLYSTHKIVEHYQTAFQNLTGDGK